MASSRNNPSIDSLLQSFTDCLADLPDGTHIGVALSGGLDSAVLLSLAARYAATKAVRLSAIHVHHGLSPHADAWAAFCQRRCAALDIPLEIVYVLVPRDRAEGLEAAARRLRYQAFALHPAQHLVLAHHANDQAETLLFNLMRGAGVRGAAAIPFTSQKGRYLRPLLKHERSELEAYAAIQRLQWVDDESNDDLSYSRNYIRHAVIPILLQRFPAAVRNLARSVEHFSEAQKILDEMARHDLAATTDFPVSLALLQALSEARARNVLRFLLAMRGLQSPTEARLNEALRQFFVAAPDRHPSLELPSYRLFRTRGQVNIEQH